MSNFVYDYITSYINSTCQEAIFLIVFISFGLYSALKIENENFVQLEES